MAWVGLFWCWAQLRKSLVPVPLHELTAQGVSLLEAGEGERCKSSVERGDLGFFLM